MSNLDKQKREALKNFRGQANNKDYDSDRMFSHHHDGTYAIHRHHGQIHFNVMTAEEREQLLVKRIADLQRMVDCEMLDEIPLSFQELLLQGGEVHQEFEADVVNDFYITCDLTVNDWCGSSSYDWEAAEKTFQAQLNQEAS